MIIDSLNEKEKEEKIVNLSKKLKILKAAFMKERQEKAAIEVKTNDYKKKIELTQIELDEKVILFENR